MAEACGELHYEMETDETIFLLLDNFYLFPFGSFPPPPPPPPPAEAFVAELHCLWLRNAVEDEFE